MNISLGTSFSLLAASERVPLGFLVMENVLGAMCVIWTFVCTSFYGISRLGQKHVYSIMHHDSYTIARDIQRTFVIGSAQDTVE